jgi:hypothetical protein
MIVPESLHWNVNGSVDTLIDVPSKVTTTAMKLQCISVDFASLPLVSALYNAPTQQFVRSNLPVASNRNKRRCQTSKADKTPYESCRVCYTLSLETLWQEWDDLNWHRRPATSVSTFSFIHWTNYHLYNEQGFCNLPVKLSLWRQEIVLLEDTDWLKSGLPMVYVLFHRNKKARRDAICVKQKWPRGKNSYNWSDAPSLTPLITQTWAVQYNHETTPAM